MKVELEIDSVTGEVKSIETWVINDDMWRENIELPAGLMASIGVQLQQRVWAAKE